MCTKKNYLPVQVTPSPVQPELQAHLNDPMVFVQVACAWQLSVSLAHSLISKDKSGC